MSWNSLVFPTDRCKSVFAAEAESLANYVLIGPIPAGDFHRLIISHCCFTHNDGSNYFERHSVHRGPDF